MRLRLRWVIWLPVVILCAPLVAARPAAATTFCVPSFHGACPNSGGNVAQGSLETAMQTNGGDAAPDRILIAAGTVTDATPYELLSGDSDDLEIVGAGPGATNITISSSGNQFVMNLDGGRDVTMRDLTIRIPASFPNNGGSALQAVKATLENIDVESRNPGSSGVFMVGGGTFRDGRIYSAMGGSLSLAITGNGAKTGSLLIEGTSIEGAGQGVVSDDPEVPVFVRRVRILDPVNDGVVVTEGAFAVVENSIIEASTAIPILAVSTDPGTVMATVRHTTIVGSGVTPSTPAIKSWVLNTAGNGPVNFVVSDTIISGYPNPLWCEAPTAANVGNASLTIKYSWFFHSGFASGDCTLSNPNTIDSADPAVGAPQFMGPTDYHLPLSSPAIDRGDPATATLPTLDFDGALRPVDGNADGTVRRDMGAFEYQPPSGGGGGGGGTGDPTPQPQEPAPQPTPGDTTAPGVTKVGFRHSAGGRSGGVLRVTLSENATLRVVLRPFGRSTKLAKRRTYRLTYSARQGPNRFRIKRRLLRMRRYSVVVVATDGAGNRSQAARQRVRPRR